MAARDTLFIQLRDDAPEGRLAYALTGANAGSGLRVEHGTLETILSLAPGRRIVVFVPGADVRLSSVQVPARQPQKVLQAAPYALEDQLAEDVDTLHFAIAPDAQRRAANAAHPVAITARTRMDAWLAPLRQAGLKAQAVVPETLSLPPPEELRWTGLAEAGRVTVRTGAYTGFACTLDDLGTYLQIADPDARAQLRLFVAREADRDFSTLGRPVELLPGYGSALEVLARNWRPENSINLLQGAYAPQEDWQRAVQPWRTAAGIAAAWLAVTLAAQAAHAFRAGQELRRLEEQNLARYRSLFPAETRIVDLAAQAQTQLAALRSGGARAPLFALLGSVSQALAANPGLTLQSLQFREGALHLSLTGSDLQALESLRTWYGRRSDAVLHVEAANAGAEGVQIRLKVTLA
jgi:general secretion pathway protein L